MVNTTGHDDDGGDGDESDGGDEDEERKEGSADLPQLLVAPSQLLQFLVREKKIRKEGREERELLKGREEGKEGTFQEERNFRKKGLTARKDGRTKGPQEGIPGIQGRKGGKVFQEERKERGKGQVWAQGRERKGRKESHPFEVAFNFVELVQREVTHVHTFAFFWKWEK
jgi:hypothetical protein